MESERYKKYKAYKHEKFKNRLKIFATSAFFCFNISIMRNNYHEIKELFYTEYEASSSDYDINTIEKCEFDTFKVKLINTYTKEELKYIKKVEINLIDDIDYSYLNDMTNLEELIINDYSTKPVLTNIDGKVFKKNMNIEIYRKNTKQEFSEERFSFIKDIPYIDKLTLGKPCKIYHFLNNPLLNNYMIKLSESSNTLSYNIESEFLESLSNVHNLSLAIDPYFNYNYKDLSFLDSLYLNGNIYDIPIFFSEIDIYNIKNSGVEVKVDDYFGLRDIYNKIDNIALSLDINENSSDIEIINKILAYVLNNCEYTDNKNLTLFNTAKYYYNGYLRGIFENNKQICGNYAALFQALLNRFNIESNLIHAENHVWNSVNLNNKEYYFDPTWMDDNRVYKISEKNYYVLDENEKEVLVKDYDKIPDIEVARIEEKIVEKTNIQLLNEYSNQLLNLPWYYVEPEKVEDVYHIPLFLPTDVEKNIDSDIIKLSEKKRISETPLLPFYLEILCSTALFIGIPLTIRKRIKYDKKCKEEIKKLLNPYE